MKICVICSKEIDGYGNNAAPIKNGKCCDLCNEKVIKARIFEAMTYLSDINKKRGGK